MHCKLHVNLEKLAPSCKMSFLLRHWPCSCDGKGTDDFFLNRTTVSTSVTGLQTIFGLWMSGRSQCEWSHLQSSRLTKRRISSSSYSSFVFEWRPELFWWPLWKCLPRSPDTLPNTRGRALRSSAAGSPHPTSPTNPTPRIILYGCDIHMLSLVRSG